MNHVVPSMMAMEHGIKGHVGMTTMASAGGAIAIGEAYRLVKHGYCERIVAGGLDFNVTPLCHGGMDSFGALTKQFNENPQDSMRPFDKQRSGTVLSDGGSLIVLESEEAAMKRSAEKVYGEIVGFEMTSDAFHVLRPTDSGIGLVTAMQKAMI